jgi:hypothetical protein
MKKVTFTIGLLSVCLLTFGQTKTKTETKPEDRADSTRRADYDRFIGKILNLNSNAPQTNFLFDISKSPSLKLSLPIYTGNVHQWFLDGNISSTNDYTPLIKKGEWAPDASVNLSYTWFAVRSTKFYDREVSTNGIIDPVKLNNALISDASQLFWLWVTAKAGYNYSNYIFYNDSANIALDKRTFDKDYNKSFFKLTGNFFFYPSKDNCKWFTLSGNLGYQYLLNDNNYSSLKSVNVKTLKTFADTSGNSVEVLMDETTAKKGVFKVSNASVIDYNVMTLFSPTEKFYFGLSFYGKTRITKDLNSTDIGFGLTIPIQKVNGDSKTAASFTLKYDIPDINNELSTLTLKEKGKLGFTIGIPITTFKPHK